MKDDINLDGDIEDLVHLSFFVDIGKAISSSTSINEILKKVMEQIGEIFTPINWSLLLVDRKANELIFKIAVGNAADKLQGKRIPLKTGITGWIVATGQPVIIQDVKTDKRFDASLDKMTGFTTKSLIGVPLKTGNKVIGVIELINKLNGQLFTPFEMKILSTIADFAAIAIEKAFYIQAMRRISMQDYLTGLLNRRSLDSIIKHEIERSKRFLTPLSILIIDIDDFKKINDTYGHLKGDDVLIFFANLLKRNVRQVDYVARFGGDEFTVVMPDTPVEQAESVKERILCDLKLSCENNKTLPFAVSIGLCSSGPEDVENILQATDMDLYENKEQKEPVDINKNLFDFISSEK